MLKTLMASIREYKRAAIATPIIVTGEVVMEVAIPFVTAQLINAIQLGAGLAQLLPYAADASRRGESPMDFENSQTKKNLETAFAGESQAHTKYRYYSSQAKKYGYVQISDIFMETAKTSSRLSRVRPLPRQRAAAPCAASRVEPWNTGSVSHP